MPDKPFATGQCQCGAVSFTVAAAPVAMGQCHCKDCQRVIGTGHISLARFNRSDVTIEGTTKTFAVKADSGNITRGTSVRTAAATCSVKIRRFPG